MNDLMTNPFISVAVATTVQAQEGGRSGDPGVLSGGGQERDGCAVRRDFPPPVGARGIQVPPLPRHAPHHHTGHAHLPTRLRPPPPHVTSLHGPLRPGPTTHSVVGLHSRL